MGPVVTKKSTRLTAEEIQALVGNEANEDSESTTPASEENTVEVKAVEFADFGDDPSPVVGTPNTLQFLLDVPMTVEVVLGSTSLTVREVMEIGPGTVVELDQAYGEEVALYLNGRLVARGDIVVVGDHFGIRITEVLVSGREMEALAPSLS